MPESLHRYAQFETASVRDGAVGNRAYRVGLRLSYL